MVEGVLDGPVDLRHAAQRVRVLDLVDRIVVAALELAVAQEMAELSGHRDLARVRSGQLVGRGEGDVRPEQRLDAHGGSDRCGPHEPVRVREQERPDRAHQLRAVEQRETLLRSELQWFERDGAEGLGGRHDLARDLDLAAPDERQRQVGQGREVPRRPDAALLGHDRVDAVGQHREEPVDDQRATAAVAKGERVGPQQQHRADHLPRERSPDAGRVAHQQAALELA